MIGILRWVTTSELHYFAVSKMNLKTIVFYVGISSVSIKLVIVDTTAAPALYIIGYSILARCVAL